MAHTFEEQNEKVISQSVITPPEDSSSDDRLWVEFEHPEYADKKGKWEVVEDVYSGKVLDKAKHYIDRRKQGETEGAHEERANTADFGGHLASVVDSFVGMAHSTQEDTDRIWQPEEASEGLESVGAADRLTEDYDGRGTNLEAFWKEVATLLISMHRCWIGAIGIVNEDENNLRSGTVQEPHARIFKPREVLNWREQNGRLVELVTTESVDTRNTIQQAPTSEPNYLHWTPRGIDRYRIVKGDQGRTLQQIGEVTFDEPFVDRSGNEIPPVFRAELPLKRFIGWLLAKKEVVIMNKESERDFAQRVSTFNKLVPDTGEPIPDRAYEGEVNDLIKGSNVLQEPWKYINPSPEPVASSTDVLMEKVDKFYRAAFQIYKDEAVKQRTATEIRQEAHSGQDAFLNLLVGALDEAEQMTMFLLSQIELPGAGQEVWQQAAVERSRDFQPVDADQMAARLKERYIGMKPVPIGEQGTRAVVEQITDLDGVPIEEDEIETVARRANRQREQEDAMTRQILGDQ